MSEMSACVVLVLASGIKLERQKRSLHTVVQDGLVHSPIGVGP
jgi:hypothetical protein